MVEIDLLEGNSDSESSWQVRILAEKHVICQKSLSQPGSWEVAGFTLTGALLILKCKQTLIAPHTV